MDRRRRIILTGAAAALALAAFASPAPRADIRILAHEAGDQAPRRLQAAVDMGFFAVSVLVTWSARLAR